MNQYWTKSLILHGVILLLLTMGSLNMCSKDDVIKQDQAIVVDLMPIGAKTNVKPAPKQEKPQPAKKEEKKEEPKKEEKKPEDKKPEPKKEPKPDPKPAKEELPTDTAPKKPTVKPEEKEIKQPSELDDLLKTLDDKKPAPKVESNQTENTDVNSKNVSDFDPNAPLTMSELDYIKTLIQKQIYPCWNVPAGARDAGNLKIKLDVDLERDGTIKFVGFADESKYYSDSFYQVAADSARRAVLDPKCNPLKQLPPMDKFNKWRELTINFDPKDIIR